MAVLSPDRERRGPVAAASEPSARGQNPPDDLASCTLKATEPSVAQARAFTTMQLAAWDIDNEIVDAARLIVSEFVTNTVQHSGSAKLYLELIRCGSQLRIEVTDMGRWQASESPRPDSDTAENGRGLWLVEALAQECGIHRTTLGTCAWALLQDPAEDSAEDSAALLVS